MRSQSNPFSSTVVLFALFSAMASVPVAGADNAMVIGQAEGRPGEIVKLPVRITNDAELIAIGLWWDYDPSVLVPLPPTIEGTLSAALPIDGRPIELFAHEIVSEGRAKATLLSDATSEADRLFPVGADQLVLWIRFRIRSGATTGATPVTGVEIASPGEDSALVAPGGFPLSFVFVDGAVDVRAPAGPRPPELAVCRQVLDRVDLSWQNLTAFDAIVVVRDGADVASLAGTATSWSDRNAPRGAHVYGLRGIAGGASSVDVLCEVEVGDPKVEPVANLACAPEGGTTRLSWQVADTYVAS
jgi:hypothetical protein